MTSKEDIYDALQHVGESMAFGSAEQTAEAWARFYDLKPPSAWVELQAGRLIADLLTRCAELAEDERARCVGIIDRGTRGLPDFSHVRESMEAVRDQITGGEASK